MSPVELLDHLGELLLHPAGPDDRGASALAYLWEQRPTAGRRWSPLQLLGRSSLFVYWIHVELVYGLISLPLHGAFHAAAAPGSGLVFVCLSYAGRGRRKDWG